MTNVKPLTAALSTLVLSAACTDGRRDALNAEWQQMMRCSAYFTLRASSARDSGTAAASRTTAAAQVDAALASRYSHELAELAGHSLPDADRQLREIGDELWDAIDADLDNIGRLRTRYEEPCRKLIGDGEARTDYWRDELR
jgi:hypothetical protein